MSKHHHIRISRSCPQLVIDHPRLGITPTGPNGRGFFRSAQPAAREPTDVRSAISQTMEGTQDASARHRDVFAHLREVSPVLRAPAAHLVDAHMIGESFVVIFVIVAIEAAV